MQPDMSLATSVRLPVSPRILQDLKRPSLQQQRQHSRLTMMLNLTSSHPAILLSMPTRSFFEQSVTGTSYQAELTLFTTEL